MKQFLIIFILSIYSKISYLSAVKLEYLCEDLKFFLCREVITLLGLVPAQARLFPQLPEGIIIPQSNLFQLWKLLYNQSATVLLSTHVIFLYVCNVLGT